MSLFNTSNTFSAMNQWVACHVLVRLLKERITQTKKKNTNEINLLKFIIPSVEFNTRHYFHFLYLSQYLCFSINLKLLLLLTLNECFFFFYILCSLC